MQVQYSVTNATTAFNLDDWALVVPHPQDPVIRVWAEAATEPEAVALAGEFADLVEELKG